MSAQLERFATPSRRTGRYHSRSDQAIEITKDSQVDGVQDLKERAHEVAEEKKQEKKSREENMATSAARSKPRKEEGSRAEKESPDPPAKGRRLFPILTNRIRRAFWLDERI